MHAELEEDMSANELLDARKLRAASWFRELRDQICDAFEQIEDELTGPLSNQDVGQFERTPWKREGGDGGEISMMKGRVFEKVGVNISTVEGEFDERFRKEIPGAEADPRYWASGISLVAHHQSPLVPAAHFNTRMIVVGDGARVWFGGGGDLNPMFEVAQDTQDFHAAFESVCNSFRPDFFPAFKGWCDEYFYIKHRDKPRGVGGIFYDYLGLNHLGADTSPVTSGRFGKGGADGELTQKGMEVSANAALDWEDAFDFTQHVGRAFRDIYQEIIRRHLNKEWNDEQREHQLMKRGHYAEYNLLYDRGTRFGLMTGGNTEAILMSLPPIAKWP